MKGNLVIATHISKFILLLQSFFFNIRAFFCKSLV